MKSYRKSRPGEMGLGQMGQAQAATLVSAMRPFTGSMRKRACERLSLVWLAH